MRRATVLAGLLFLSPQAFAASVYRPASDAPEAVWTNANAAREGMALIADGLNQTKPELFAGLAACVVEPWTPIVVIAREAGFATVRVTGGAHEGCRGVMDSRAVSD